MTGDRVLPSSPEIPHRRISEPRRFEARVTVEFIMEITGHCYRLLSVTGDASSQVLLVPSPPRIAALASQADVSGSLVELKRNVWARLVREERGIIADSCESFLLLSPTVR